MADLLNSAKQLRDAAALCALKPRQPPQPREGRSAF